MYLYTGRLIGKHCRKPEACLTPEAFISYKTRCVQKQGSFPNKTPHI